MTETLSPDPVYKQPETLLLPEHTVDAENVAVDPSVASGNVLPTELLIKHETFGQAQTATKQLSDKFVDGAINGNLKIGSESVGVKGYLDRVETTGTDKEVIDSPERIANLYVSTTEMIARNLKVRIARNSDPEQAQKRRDEVKGAKETFLQTLGEQTPTVATEIIDWSNGDSRTFPVGAVEYLGFNVNGKDILDMDTKGASDIRPNMKIQRQAAGVFVMAYSDKQVDEKMIGKDEVQDKRIYLNPDMEATPALFEQVLQAANETGIPLQLKMFQRAPELATAHRAKSKGHETASLRGDGIVIYVNGKQADEVLGMVLALAKDNPETFKGRKTSRIPQFVAEGIAVGDEPIQMPGKSLTSHRELIFSYAAEKTKESGKQGQEARDLFRDLSRRASTSNGVNPDNIAFNA